LEISVGGIPPLSHFTFSGNKSLEAQTLFTQLMLEKGFLAGKSFYSSFAHLPRHIKKYELAACEVFEIIANAIANGNIDQMLKGPVAHTGFKRLT
ncbi:MAG: aminotransferase class III, partial [Candidatus Bathyarchaeota archaeon]|nr:aminotransferase class III [Candidatus Bathyarchaeota archaeon]